MYILNLFSTSKSSLAKKEKKEMSYGNANTVLVHKTCIN